MRTLQRTLIGLVLGLLLGSAAIVEGQSGPYAAQIQSAMRSLGLSVVSGVTKISQAVTVTCTGSTSGTTYAPTTYASTGICTFGQQGDTGALYMTYNTTDNVGVLGVLSPGTAWRALFVNPGGGDVTVGFGSRIGFSPSNTTSTGDTFFTRGGAAGKMVLTGTTPMVQLGGTTSSFPAWKQIGTQIVMRLADDSAVPGFGRSTAQTAAVASVATYTVGAADASFQVDANVLVTTATTHTFTIECAYTDEGNTARTLTMSFTLVAGGTVVTSVANGNGAVPYMGIPQHIRAKASTTITIRTQAAGTYTTVTYNVEGLIRQVA